MTFGFDTAVTTAIEAIDKLHTTAESHDRVMVLEVMGRDAGFIALYAGVAGTADVILVPEIAWTMDAVCEKIRARDAAGGASASSWWPRARHARRVKGIIGESLPGQARRVGGWRKPSRARFRCAPARRRARMVLGHLQRGGSPTGVRPAAGHALRRRGRRSDCGRQVGAHGGAAVAPPRDGAHREVLQEPKRVEPDHDIVRTARAVGISFGDRA
jgi:ATP-dependent phosphofructokinase / diphosphate-dependent phosphofructokinase